MHETNDLRGVSVNIYSINLWNTFGVGCRFFI